MTLNVIDFLRESSKFMAKDSPDIYESDSEALEVLVSVMETMRETPGSGLTSFANYMLIRYQEEGMDEWDLVRKLSSVVMFDDEQPWIHAHTHNSGTLKYGVDLPPVEDLD